VLLLIAASISAHATVGGRVVNFTTIKQNMVQAAGTPPARPLVVKSKDGTTQSIMVVDFQ
jgi:hypothetical protein